MDKWPDIHHNHSSSPSIPGPFPELSLPYPAVPILNHGVRFLKRIPVLHASRLPISLPY